MDDHKLIGRIERLARAKVRVKRYDLVVSDIEGCINRSEYIYDHAGIAVLRRICELGSQDNILPRIALCSGRQYPFVEAIASVLSISLPCAFENGAGMYHPQVPLYRRIEHDPRVSEFDWGGAGRVGLAKTLTADGKSVMEIGKEYILTLHPCRDITVDELREKVSEHLNRLNINVSVGSSASAVDICPPGVDKGSAIAWIAALCSVPLSAVAAIGDSEGDIAMLSRSGISGAPSNARKSVRELVDYMARQSDVRGVIEFVLHVAELNAVESQCHPSI